MMHTYYNDNQVGGMVLRIHFFSSEIEDIPVPNYKELLSQLDKAEASGRTSEVLRAFADMAKTIENIEDGDNGRT